MPTFPGRSWDVWAFRIPPAVERSLWLGTDVAGTERHARAMAASRGSNCALSLHHFKHNTGVAKKVRLIDRARYTILFIHLFQKFDFCPRILYFRLLTICQIVDSFSDV